MKTVFMSELLGKTFNSEAECLKAEREYTEKVHKAEEAKKLASKEVSAQKKLLADKIAKADEELTKALEGYEISKEDAEDIYKEAREEIDAIIAEAKDDADEILSDARNKVRDAQRAKFNAVQEFNKKFGAYEVKYTGEKAANEFNRINKYISNLMDSVFRWS